MLFFMESCYRITLSTLTFDVLCLLDQENENSGNTTIHCCDCRHYGAFLQCAAFVMRVENYRCSEDQIEEMAQDHYWLFMRGMPSSDWSGRPTSTMDPYRTAMSSDRDGYKSSYSRSDMFDRSSDMSSSFDTFDASSPLYSSSARPDRPSDIQGSSDHMMDSSALHGSPTGDYLHSSHLPHDDDSSYYGKDYMNSLPFSCKGELYYILGIEGEITVMAVFLSTHFSEDIKLTYLN